MVIWTDGDHGDDGRISLWGAIELGRLEARVHRIYRIRIARRRAFMALREWCASRPRLIAGAQLAGGVTVGVAYLLFAWLVLLAFGD